MVKLSAVFPFDKMICYEERLQWMESLFLVCYIDGTVSYNGESNCSINIHRSDFHLKSTLWQKLMQCTRFLACPHG